MATSTPVKKSLYTPHQSMTNNFHNDSGYFEDSQRQNHQLGNTGTCEFVDYNDRVRIDGWVQRPCDVLPQHQLPNDKAWSQDTYCDQLQYQSTWQQHSTWHQSCQEPMMFYSWETNMMTFWLVSVRTLLKDAGENPLISVIIMERSLLSRHFHHRCSNYFSLL